MEKVIKTIWNIITTILVILAVLLAIMLVGVRVVGLQPLMVLSGSMEPTYPTGSILYVRDVDPFTLKEGDVITYMLGNEKTKDPEDYVLSTHRIIEVIPDEDEADVVRFRMKGDANETEDGALVHCENVVGTPVFHLPYMGFVANYIQNPPGMYIAIAAGAILILFCFLPDLLFGSDKDKKNKKDKKDKKGKNGKKTDEEVEEALAGLKEEEAGTSDAEQTDETVAAEEQGSETTEG